MRVAIIGSGRLGRSVRAALARRGVPASLHSRSTGFDVLDAPRSLPSDDVDVVVEATDIFTQNRRRAIEFFTRSTRAVNAVARNAGARHILVSIVNCQKPELHGMGYYFGKAEQERVAFTEHAGLTVVRSTQWFEFARQNLDRMRLGPLAIIPAMTVQPLALETVATVVAECATGARTGELYEVAGPERTTLRRMTAALPGRRAALIPLPVPGTAGRALRDGALLPGPMVEIAGPSFAEWLSETPQ